MKKTLLLMTLLLLLSSCAIYKLDIQQGNTISEQAIAELKQGMSKDQVKALLGTPLLADSFQNNRWDYVFYLNKAGKQVERKDLVLHFSDNQLSRIQRK
ncbi:MAG: outer membrane protein assembly factor BamE [Thiotrichaceae bacterium]|nr:outer membrane protein assembly factor BamE [Thiotrichaceae bacterium]